MVFRIPRTAAGCLRPVSSNFWTAALSGVLIATWLHQSVSLLGTSLAASSSLLLVAGLSVSIGLRLSDFITSARRSAGIHVAGQSLALLIAGLAGVFSTQLVQLENACLAVVSPAGMWPSLAEQFLIYLAVHSLIIIPVAASVCAGTLSAKAEEIPRAGLTGMRLMGLATGIMLAGFACIPIANAATTALVAGVSAMLLSATVFAVRYRNPIADSVLATGPQCVSRSGLQRCRIPIAGLFYGVAFGCLSRVLEQLFIDAAWITVAEFCAILLGMAAVFSPVCRKWSVATSFMWAAAFCAVLIALFPLGIQASLNISTYMSQTAMIAASRSGLIAFALIPLGAFLALASFGPAGKPSLTSGLIMGFVFGIAVCRAFLLSTIGPVTTLVCVIAGLMLTGITALIRMEGFVHTIRRPAFPASLIAGLTTPFWSQNYQPERTARLLFDTRIFHAHQIEPRSEILEHLDEARCLAVTDGDDGTLSLWRRQGSQLQIRRSGMPHSSISVDTTVAPQPTGESLQAILPLVLHDRPTSILFLGLGTGATVRTALQFPVSRICCAETDSRLIDLVCQDIYSRVTPNPLQDERVEILQCDPILATAVSGNFDLIVCSPGHLSQPGPAAQSTVEFLSRAAARLNPGGLICQQFRYVDFGAETVDSLFATWNSVFAQSAAIESAPGELLLVGSIDTAGLYRKGFVDRLKHHHVRHALSGSGFDWATPLQLTLFDLNHIQQQSAAPGEHRSTRPRIQTAAAASLLSRGPWDVMRWGEKYAEVRKAFNSSAQSLATVFSAAAEDADVQRRLGELDLRRTLIHDKADSYWSYRSEMKRHLRDSPRADIIQVKGGGQKTRLHHEERQRIAYFKALGQAAFQERPTGEILQPVEEFETPYDPIISFFMHQEIAELAARDTETNYRLEFRHRRHRVNFTSSQDRSVRNLIATINLLCDYPALITSPAERADQLDALLQILHRRWQNRGTVAPVSTQMAMNDIDESLKAGERIFEVLSDLGPERNKSPQDIAIRRIALEKSLMRPLRSYRSQLLRRKQLQQAVGQQ